MSKALEVFGTPAAVSCDRWRDADLVDAMRAADVPVVPLERRGQGFKDGGEDVRAFRMACISGNVTPTESLYLTSCMSCARVLIDPAGNSKLSKSTPAAILAVSLGARRTRKSSQSSGVYMGAA